MIAPLWGVALPYVCASSRVRAEHLVRAEADDLPQGIEEHVNARRDGSSLFGSFEPVPAEMVAHLHGRVPPHLPVRINNEAGTSL